MMSSYIDDNNLFWKEAYEISTVERGYVRSMNKIDI